MKPLVRLGRVALVGLLGTSLSGCFTAPAQIVSLDPNRGSTGVAADAPIRVTFDRPVRADSVATHFSVSPSIAGCNLQKAFNTAGGGGCRVRWLTDQPGFELDHVQAIFAPDTRYTFDLGAGIVDASGEVNSLDHQWDITSDKAPEVSGTNPGDGAVVPRDAALAVTFTRPKDESTTSSAVSLQPAVPGTRVIRNERDHSRFLIAPGSPLRAGITYTLQIAGTATDEHGQPLKAPVTIHFGTTAMTPADHVLVLANHQGEGATDVVMTGLRPPQFGDPVPSEVLLRAPRCTAPSGCGLVPPGGPLVNFRDARLSPGSLWLAVVESDETVAAAPLQLRVIAITDGSELLRAPGASQPAWSTTGSTLAYVAGDGSAQLFTPATRTGTSLPPGGPLGGRPVWLGDGETVALPVQATATRPASIDLAVPALAARYPLPGLTRALSNPVAAPTSSEMAVSRDDGPPYTGSGVWVVAADGTASELPGNLDSALKPVGFLDSGRLLCEAQIGLVVVTVATHDIRPIAQPQVSAGEITTLQLAPSGRELGYIDTDGGGVAQGFVANADGTGALPITQFLSGVNAVALSFQ